MARMLILFALSAASLGGCVAKSIQPYQAFEDGNVSASDVAILHVPEYVYFKAFNGAKATYPGSGLSYGGARVLLKPGEVTASATYRDFNRASAKPIPLTFSVDAGKEYFVNPSYKKVDYQTYIDLVIHECGGAIEREIDAERRNRDVWLPYQPPCP